MSAAIEQRAAGALPPLRPSVGTPPSAVRHGHYAMVARMMRDFEVSAERITDLDEIPMDLLARFARALNQAERRVLARVQTLEEAES
jgi:hypothetical protein